MSTRPTNRITINNRTYGSVEEMPPDVRAQYERAMAALPDENHNGVPDILEQNGATHVSKITTVTRLVINGREYSSLEDVPPDLRRSWPTPACWTSSESSKVRRARLRD